MAPLWSEQDLSMTGVDGPDGRWAGPLRPALLLGGADEGDMLSRFQSLLSTHVAFFIAAATVAQGLMGSTRQQFGQNKQTQERDEIKESRLATQ